MLGTVPVPPSQERRVREDEGRGERSAASRDLDFGRRACFRDLGHPDVTNITAPGCLSSWRTGRTDASCEDFSKVLIFKGANSVLLHFFNMGVPCPSPASHRFPAIKIAQGAIAGRL